MDISRRDFLKTSAFGFISFLSGSYRLPEEIRDFSNPYNRIAPLDYKNLDVRYTFCNLCPSFCGIKCYIKDGCLVALEAMDESPINGGICPKAVASLGYLYDKERIRVPLVRAGKRGEGKFRPVTWNEVLTIIKNEGKDGLFIDADTNDLVEKYALSSMPFDGLNLSKPSMKDEIEEEFFGKGVEVYFDLKNSDFILIFGSDIVPGSKNFPDYVNAILGRRGKCIVFDPRFSKTAGSADKWMPIRPESDVYALLYIANKLGIKGVRSVSDRELENETGISPKEMNKIVEGLKSSISPVVFYGKGVTERRNGKYAVYLVYLINKALGRINKKGGMFIQQPKALVTVKSKPFDPYTLLKEGKIKTYVVYNTNPFLIYPDAKGFASYVKNAKLIIEITTHLTGFSPYADIILPTATFYERWGAGSVVSGLKQYLLVSSPVVEGANERRELRRKGIDIKSLFSENLLFKPYYYSKGIAEISYLFSKALGVKVDFRSERDIVKGILERLGLSMGELKSRKGIIDLGYVKAVGIHGIAKKPTFEIVKKEKGMELIVFHDGLADYKTIPSKWVQEISHENPLFINDEDAKKLGIKDGDKVVLESDVGKITVRAVPIPGIMPGVVAMALFHGETYGNPFVMAKKVCTDYDRDTHNIWWKSRGYNPMRVSKPLVLKEKKISSYLGTRVNIKKV